MTYRYPYLPLDGGRSQSSRLHSSPFVAPWYFSRFFSAWRRLGHTLRAHIRISPCAYLRRHVHPARMHAGMALGSMLCLFMWLLQRCAGCGTIQREHAAGAARRQQWSAADWKLRVGRRLKRLRTTDLHTRTSETMRTPCGLHFFSRFFPSRFACCSPARAYSNGVSVPDRLLANARCGE